MQTRFSCLLFFLLTTLSLPAQEPVPDETSEKGIIPISSPSADGGGQEGATYAVVVGISDYQDEGIPDLRFAHKDAEAFAAFLQSPAGGSLDEDHLRVLLNNNATLGRFATALDWLWEVAGENDRVIIYFSGHGDVEKKSILSPGYLLCWDAPDRVYMGGGALNVRDLKGVVSTLSLRNKAKVLLITDACRAGKLSGNSIKGPQATAVALNEQFANEIKILSCQPDEYSIEGEEWGGGRGVFSYHLLDGLYGLADRNGDRRVNLMEIRSYLEQKVSEEVAPQEQFPMTVGNGKEPLFAVNPDLLARIKEGKKGQLLLLSSTESKGIEEETLARVDSSVLATYNAFKQALQDKQFLAPKGACADYYYQQLMAEPQLAKLHSTLRRNYAAELVDDSQQVLKKLIDSDPGENSKALLSNQRDYQYFPANIRRAAELLGKDHYLYNTLMARSYWFEGYIKDEADCNSCKNIPNANRILPLYKKALEYDPQMPHALRRIMTAYGSQKQELDTAAYYANLALDAVPGWLLVYEGMANIYLNKYNSFVQTKNEKYLDQAKNWLDQGLAIDSNAVVIMNQLAFWYNLKGLYKEEQAALDKSFSIDSLAQTQFFKGQGYLNWGKFKEAEKAFRYAIELDQDFLLDPRGLAELYNSTLQTEKLKKLCQEVLDNNLQTPYLYADYASILTFYPKERIKMLLRAKSLDSLNHTYYNSLSDSYVLNSDYEKALSFIKRAIELSPDYGPYHANEGLIYLRLNQFEAAEKKFSEAEALGDKVSAYRFLLYLQRGMEAKAREQLIIHMKRDPSFPYFLGQWGAAYLHGPDKVLHAFQLMEEMYPHSPHVNSGYMRYLMDYKRDTAAAFAALEKALRKGLKKQQLRFYYSAPLKMNRERWNKLIEPYYPEIIIE